MSAEGGDGGKVAKVTPCERPLDIAPSERVALTERQRAYRDAAARKEKR